VTHDQRISTYNRLDSTMAIVHDIIRLYKPEPDVLAELLAAYTAMKMAQDGLGWDPGGHVAESCAK